MRALLFYLLPALCVVWAVWGAFEYRRLKAALAAGRREALLREYRLTIAGELLFGALSLLAVGPAILRGSPAFRVPLPKDATDFAGPIIIGLTIGSLFSVVAARLLARQGRGLPQAGDFAALLPRAARERWLYAAVALSAGICEELCFRGFGLRFFAQLGLTGYALPLVAALAFGLLHLYQGVAGIAATFAVGLLLGALYLLTGTLLVPIVLHVLIDLRPLALPATSPADRPSRAENRPY